MKCRNMTTHLELERIVVCSVGYFNVARIQSRPMLSWDWDWDLCYG